MARSDRKSLELEQGASSVAEISFPSHVSIWKKYFLSRSLEEMISSTIHIIQRYTREYTTSVISLSIPVSYIYMPMHQLTLYFSPNPFISCWKYFVPTHSLLNPAFAACVFCPPFISTGRSETSRRHPGSNAGLSHRMRATILRGRNWQNSLGKTVPIDGAFQHKNYNISHHR